MAKKRGRPAASEAQQKTPKHAASAPPLPPPTAVSLPPPARPLPPHQLVLAPMVGGSELAFRLLARRHGAQLCYTPMIHSADFVKGCHVANDGPSSRGVGPLQTCAGDAPLVAHFCGNNAATLLAAARRAEPYCAAVDLNLGCPQRSAHAGHYGSFLLDPPDRPLVLKIVSTLARGLRVPVFCKIRLLDDPGETITFVKQLEAAGCALLAVHGRKRGDPMHRRSGPADLQQVAAVKEALRIPVLSNGNVRSASELLASFRVTNADGVMSAEAALDDPAIFRRATDEAAIERERLTAAVRLAKRERDAGRSGDASKPERKRLVAVYRDAKAALRRVPALEPPAVAKAGIGAAGSGWDGVSASAPTAGAATAESSRLQLAFEYLELTEVHPAPISCVTFHLRRLCKQQLTQYELLAPLLAATTRQGAQRVMQRCAEFASGRASFEAGAPPFVADPPEAKALAAAMAAHPGLSAEDAEAAARTVARAASERKRRAFEARMAKKARAEGKPDGHYYEVGLTPPSREELLRLRDLSESEQVSRWKLQFGRHCREHYLEGRCPWELDPRGCGFLHPGDDIAPRVEGARAEAAARDAEATAACG